MTACYTYQHINMIIRLILDILKRLSITLPYLFLLLHLLLFIALRGLKLTCSKLVGSKFFVVIISWQHFDTQLNPRLNLPWRKQQRLRWLPVLTLIWVVQFKFACDTLTSVAASEFLSRVFRELLVSWFVCLFSTEEICWYFFFHCLRLRFIRCSTFFVLKENKTFQYKHWVTPERTGRRKEKEIKIAIRTILNKHSGRESLESILRVVTVKWICLLGLRSDKKGLFIKRNWKHVNGNSERLWISAKLEFLRNLMDNWVMCLFHVVRSWFAVSWWI